MKSFIVIKLIVGIILVSTVSYINISFKKDSVESKECLKVKGIAVADGDKYIDSVEVRLLEKNEEMEWIEVTNVPYHDHSFYFTLETNKYYTIEVSKPGYIKRLIAISTYLPTNISLKPIFEYSFEVELFKEKKGIDDYYLDFPIAIISFNKQKGVFDNNHRYTHNIKTKIKEEQEQYNNRWSF